VDTIADASLGLAEKRHGAIIVIERETGLEDYIDTGQKLDAVASKELLMSIFFPNTALHDGAVVMREDRVVAASCTLPLSDRMDGFHGTRHRGALGVTERSDAIALVVSEETGQIAIAANGRIISNLDAPRLRGILRSLLLPSTEMDRPREDACRGSVADPGLNDAVDTELLPRGGAVRCHCGAACIPLVAGQQGAGGPFGRPGLRAVDLRHRR
jgi:hypothetical protein